MKTTDQIFIENNICSINDAIINELIRIREEMIAEYDLKHVPAIEFLIICVRFAKEKGVKIETRLKKYLFTIRALGFTRDKEMEEIEINDNILSLIPKDEMIANETEH